jgi:hypothetical protein
VSPARLVEPDEATRQAMADGYGRWTEALARRGWLAGGGAYNQARPPVPPRS